MLILILVTCVIALCVVCCFTKVRYSKIVYYFTRDTEVVPVISYPEWRNEQLLKLVDSYNQAIRGFDHAAGYVSERLTDLEFSIVVASKENSSRPDHHRKKASEELENLEKYYEEIQCLNREMRSLFKEDFKNADIKERLENFKKFQNALNHLSIRLSEYKLTQALQGN